MKLNIIFLALLTFSQLVSAELIIVPPAKTHTECDRIVNQYGRETWANCREVPGPPVENNNIIWPIESMNQNPKEVISVHKDEGGWVHVRRRNGQSEIWSETSPGHYEKN